MCLCASPTPLCARGSVCRRPRMWQCARGRMGMWACGGVVNVSCPAAPPHLGHQIQDVAPGAAGVGAGGREAAQARDGQAMRLQRDHAVRLLGSCFRGRIAPPVRRGAFRRADEPAFGQAAQREAGEIRAVRVLAIDDQHALARPYQGTACASVWGQWSSGSTARRRCTDRSRSARSPAGLTTRPGTRARPSPERWHQSRSALSASRPAGPNEPGLVVATRSWSTGSKRRIKLPRGPSALCLLAQTARAPSAPRLPAIDRVPSARQSDPSERGLLPGVTATEARSLPLAQPRQMAPPASRRT